ncbi:amidohydrolase family protein [Staphylococcus epidermidis]|uniref:amidohydrolase family protein n=1 Tax=Staphylococcus epidermidis TaxID=1282 RepID=UPI0028FDCB78|nr:amidohydrolase family protein [Staphylococcus epidermidis]MCG1098868.1 amidohydrolase family protein [Staphylococcus epidermidis]MCG1684259.1 amidohydrolase family protein [Staphylococcus epidermidis]MCG1990410.1 amidohydrolase family protein [Staphylococcus epidermidis]MCG2039961.1 amidohydrolase family protein [Staphylococcus epidermidis]MDU0489000.1 amidohydrolase family protein [Staphylococcus epidermidis]
MKKFDAHLHIIDYEYQINENNGYMPLEYKSEVNSLNIIGGAIVSGSFQGFDQSYLIDTLNKLNGNYVGVTQLPHSVTDDELIFLNNQGVSGLRFNVKRGGSEDLSKLEYFAKRVNEVVGWHTELYIDSKKLSDIKTTIKKLPAVSIDHLGLSKEGLPHMPDLVEQGVKVKATGFSRTDLDIPNTLRSIYNINPEALMFGTDLPSTRAPYRFNENDIQIIENNFTNEECENIFYKNATKWYRIKEI